MHSGWVCADGQCGLYERSFACRAKTFHSRRCGFPGFQEKTGQTTEYLERDSGNSGTHAHDTHNRFYKILMESGADEAMEDLRRRIEEKYFRSDQAKDNLGRLPSSMFDAQRLFLLK